MKRNWLNFTIINITVNEHWCQSEGKQDWKEITNVFLIFLGDKIGWNKKKNPYVIMLIE